MKKQDLSPLLHNNLSGETLEEHLKSRLAFRRTWVDSFADFMTRKFGTVSFLIVNGIFFVIWILWNEGAFGLVPFDPFPYELLTMVVSLEAIMLSVIVLISQNRQGHVADVRQKLDFEIDVRSEEEITKILCMLDELQKHLGVESKVLDSELKQMQQKTDLRILQKQAEG